MSLKGRLVLLYSLLVFITLMASAVSIYILNENFRKDEFIKRLLAEAKKKGGIFFASQFGSKKGLEQLNPHTLINEQFFVTDSAKVVLYASRGSKFPPISDTQFKAAKKQPYLPFKYNKYEGIIAFESIRGAEYFIIVSAVDYYGHRKTKNLGLLLGLSVTGGMLLSWLLALFYAGQAIRPLDTLKKQMDKINEQNLKERIQVKNTDDEVGQIAAKFNEMLNRLEVAFEQRKNFVHHASHELRTPLANMLSATEVALNKNLSANDYRQVLVSLKEDQEDLIELTNALLVLSRYEKMETVHDAVPMRIDEVIYQTVESLKEVWENATIAIEFDPIPENENDLLLNGNEALIKSALHNLIKNAVQYSNDQHVKIVIKANGNVLTLVFENTGTQLSEQERPSLFIPFFRGENSIYKKGFGLGLSIAKRILNVHNGTIKYEALPDKVNRFIVSLRRT